MVVSLPPFFLLVQQFAYALAQQRVNGIRCNLGKRFKNKPSLVHQRVGDDEPVVLDGHVAIEQYVYVYYTVVVVAALGFLCAPHFAFNALGGVEQFKRCNVGIECRNAVEETVAAVEPPWLCFNE